MGQNIMETKGGLTLFGGEEGWKGSDWTASDDRVRGGRSQSYLECSSSSARFYGTLDIKTLGGAGFASQRTTGEDRSWDLSSYDGIRLDLGKSDNKRYTFIVKDEILSKNPENGREQATISYEYDFTTSSESSLAETSSIFVPWDKLTPTYRGKEKKDAPKLDKKKVKRFSIMMRSFFGDQEGDFSLNIKSIKAISLPDDLEKGLKGEKHDSSVLRGRKYWFLTKASAATLLTVALATYGVCMALCYFMKGKDAHHHMPSRLW